MTDPTRDPGRDLHPGPAGDPSASATDAARRGTVPPPNIGRGKIRHGRTVGWPSRDVARTASLVLAMYLALQLIWFANDLFLTVFLGILFAVPLLATILVIVQALYVEQLPTEGTWTHRAYTSELDELEDASGAPGARA